VPGREYFGLMAESGGRQARNCRTKKAPPGKWRGFYEACAEALRSQQERIPESGRPYRHLTSTFPVQPRFHRSCRHQRASCEWQQHPYHAHIAQRACRAAYPWLSPSLTRCHALRDTNSLMLRNRREDREHGILENPRAVQVQLRERSPTHAIRI